MVEKRRRIGDFQENHDELPYCLGVVEKNFAFAGKKGHRNHMPETEFATHHRKDMWNGRGLILFCIEKKQRKDQPNKLPVAGGKSGEKEQALRKM